MTPAAAIRGIAYALPETVVTNQDLAAEHPDWNMALIEVKTGVRSRHVCAAEETACDLAGRAARSLLEATATPASGIDALLVCTQSPDYVMPPNSALLHARLGLPKRCAAFDFTLACSGFVYGLAIAQGMIASLGLRRLMLLTADTYSRYLHPDDRSTRTLFGDGAAATLLEPAAPGSTSGFIGFQLGTDGSGADRFIVRTGGCRNPRQAAAATARNVLGAVRSDDHIYMDGKAVLDFARAEVAPTAREFLRAHGRTIDDLSLVLFHQASAVALQVLCELLEVPPGKTFSNIAHIGNTVSASIPILLADAERAGVLQRGDEILLVGFGVGFSWGCCLLTW